MNIPSFKPIVNENMKNDEMNERNIIYPARNYKVK
jgi:hypothetical protein